jgi:hemerythrin-like metal-binding protein
VARRLTTTQSFLVWFAGFEASHFSHHWEVLDVLKALIEKYLLSENLPLEARKINIVYLIGLFTALAILVLRLMLQTNLELIAITGSIAVFIVVMAYLSNRFGLFKPLIWVTTIFICYIMFPIAFFFIGGSNSAIAVYFVLAAVVLFVLHTGISRVVLVTLQFLIAGFCYLLEELHLLPIQQLGVSHRVLDEYFSFVVIALCVGAIVIFLGVLYDNERQQGQHYSRLLVTVNKSAQLLLASDLENLDASLTHAMGLLGARLDIDRIGIWHIETDYDQSYYVRQSGWISENYQKGYNPSEHVGYSVIESVPVWNARLDADEVVTGVVESLSQEEQAALYPYRAKAILLMPVHRNGALWGFMSFIDCHTENRSFATDDIDALRSTAYMFANTVTRHQDEQLLATRLEQQKLMSRVSHDFITHSSIDDLINEALQVTCEFLGATRAFTIIIDKKDDSTQALYSWSHSEQWQPFTSLPALTNLATSTFPRTKNEGERVLPVCCNDIQTDYDGKYQPFKIADVRAFIWAPIYLNDELWGLLSVEDCTQSRTWADSDLALIDSVTSALSGGLMRNTMEGERADALATALQASQAKGDFLSNMSHEMRTPMNAIIGMTSIGKGAKDLERKNQAFDKIEDASAHLLGIINDVLDMSKIEANKLELSATEFNFESMLRKVINVVNYRIEERRQRFYVTIDRLIPTTLIGDDQRLAQVVANLLSNAVKFTPDEGIIRADTQLVSEKDGVCTIKFEISDTGIGIGDEQKGRLFTSFEQADSKTSRKYGGTGLGLAISKRIVELMHGEIWVESEVDKGSTFSFTVKIQRGLGQTDSLLRADADWTNLRVLVIDDDGETLAFFRDLGERFGVACDTALGSAKALQYLENEACYDLYFVDWNIANMSALELAQRIREHNEKSHNKHSVIAMVSAADWATIEDDAKSVGVKKYLSKPLFPSMVAELVNECIEKETTPDTGERLEKMTGQFDGITILLAEDIEINQEIMIALLEPTLITIEVAADGQAALDMFMANPEHYRAIFMDMQMPTMDGLEATRQIRALEMPWAKDVPIVAMTANVFREDVERCLSAGMNDHLGKPINLDEVLEKLHHYLGASPTEPKKNVVHYGSSQNTEGTSWEHGVAWNSRLETGHEVIDQQHKQLFTLVSQLIANSRNKQDAEGFEAALHFLIDYTVQHFADEEKLQQESDYPNFEQHRKLHEAFRSEVEKFVESYRADGWSPELSSKINTTIVQWLVTHIELEDSKVAAHIKNS